MVMDGVGDSGLAQSLAGIGSRLLSEKRTIQQEGSRAFDRDDPAAARKEAGRLELIDRAEALLGELGELLAELGISGESHSPNVALEPERRWHKPNTARKGAARLEQKALHPPQLESTVLAAIQSLGGQGTRSGIRKEVGRLLEGQLSTSDLQLMPNRKLLRWEYNVGWTLTHLKNMGLVEHAEQRGVWRLRPGTRR